MKKLYPLFLFLFFSLPSFAQVTSDPEFPTITEPVTLTFDLKQSTDSRAAALLELSQKGEIFLWSGAGNEAEPFKYSPAEQTSTAWSKALPEKFQLTPLGDDVWEITLTPKTFYNIPDGADITQLGVLLKNADGSAQTENFYVPVFESGFNLSISAPDFIDGDTITMQNSSFPLTASTNEAASFSLFINNQIFKEQAVVTNFQESLPTAETGTFDVRLVASTATENKELGFSYLVLPQPEIAALPEGLEQGLNITSETAATFVLLAPQKDFVLLLGDFNDFKPSAEFVMNKTPDGEIFWLTVNNLSPDTEYAYYYLVDGEIDIADPYSETVLDASNDQYIDADRYPNLRAFPTQAGTDRLTVFSTNEEAYNWQVENFSPPAKEDLIIYELLVRDFTAKESFQGVIDRLDYLDSLNITAIQLLPIMEFNGNDSWGYNPTFQTAVDKWYGTREKLKELIDKAHQRGIAVILDITLNHQDYPAPFLKMWWQGSTASADNPFFNVSEPHPLDFFTDLNHESPYTIDFVNQVTRYWLEEYKVDGFRFDLSKGFTQKETDSYETWADYDAARVTTLKNLADEVWSVDDDAYVILEHFADNDEETELANYGLMLWGNLNHNYGEALMGYNLNNQESGFNWLSYEERGWENPNLVGYIESHDEERLIFKATEFGNSQNDYATTELETALERAELAAAFFIPVPGPKMLWQFQELGYDISIDFNGRVGKKPIKWEYLDEPDRQELFRTISELNYLKTTYPVFGTDNFEMPGLNEVRTLKLNGEDMNVVVVGNFGLEPKEASLSFQHSGWWYSYFEKDSLETSGSTSFTLAPGEFRLFTDQPIFYRGTESPTAVEDTWLSESISLYPNPSNGKTQLLLPNGVSGAVKLRLIDATGRTVWQKRFSAGGQQEHSLILQDIKPGFYAVEIVYGNKKGVKRILLQ